MGSIGEGGGSSKHREIEVSFSVPSLTAYGGIGLLSGFVRKLKVKDEFEREVQLTRRGGGQNPLPKRD